MVLFRFGHLENFFGGTGQNLLVLAEHLRWRQGAFERLRPHDLNEGDSEFFRKGL